jgi:hypothetical protein
VKLKIDQDHQYLGNDYWSWRAWISGKPADLDRIEKVKWFLHPSFPKSVVVSRERATGFRLEASGWGTFTLRAEAHLVDGTTETLREPLRLYYPDEESAARLRAASAPRRGPSPVGAEALEPGAAAAGRRRVFLSYSASDRAAAMAVRRAAESLGLEVVDESSLVADLPVDLAMSDLLSSADATIAYVASELPSPFVANAINASMKLGKPTLVLTGEDVASIAGVPADVRVVRVDLDDSKGLAQAIANLRNAAASP